MLFSLLVPFGFMIFLSFKMNKVWGLYNMMQLVSFQLKIKNLNRPTNSEILLKIVDGISNFSIGSNEFVVGLIKNVQSDVLDFVLGLGEQLLMVIALSLLLLGLTVLRFALK